MNTISRHSIWRLRRRPIDGSTNAATPRSNPGKEAYKEPPIPVATDAYNHDMNDVDCVDRIRQDFSYQTFRVP